MSVSYYPLSRNRYRCSNGDIVKKARIAGHRRNLLNSGRMLLEPPKPARLSVVVQASYFDGVGYCHCGARHSLGYFSNSATMICSCDREVTLRRRGT